MFANIWNHPKTSIAGLLIAVVTIAGVLSGQGINLGHAGTGTVVSLIGALATALLGLLAKDPNGASDSPTILKCVPWVIVALTFLSAHRRIFMLISMAAGSLAFCMLATGCVAPAWILDAEGIAATLVASATSIGAFIAGLTGNTVESNVLAAISAWAQKAELGLKNVKSLIENYKSSPNESVLQEIDQAAQTIVSDIPTLGAIENVPPEVLSKLEAWGQLVLTQLNNLTSGLPLLQSAPEPGVPITVVPPLSTAAIKAAHNALLTTTTGNAEVDAAASSAATI